MSSSDEVITMAPMAHHSRDRICDTRPAYRRGRRETAVKVFTISDESKYLLIQRVPDIKGDVKQDLSRLCRRFGAIDRLVAVDYPDCEPFTRPYLVKYTNFVSAVRAKKSLDDRSFLGSLLHVCYAPEMETLDETREKLTIRTEYVNKVLNKKQLSQPLVVDEKQNETKPVIECMDNTDCQPNTETKTNSTSKLKRKFSEMIADMSESAVNSETKSHESRGRPRIKWRHKT